MDPISHAALGRTLAALRGRAGDARGLTAAAVAGALAPDLDAVVMPFGWDRYLRVHEIGTHSLIGSLACAAVAAAAVHLGARATPLPRLWRFAWLGALSHLALDVLSGARIRLGWPLVEAHVSLPVVAMADPILLGLLLAGAIALAVAGRRQRTVAAGIVAIVTIVLAAKGAAGAFAVARYETAAGPAVAARVVEARWASLTTWQVFDRTAGRLRIWRADVRADVADLLFAWPLVPEPAVVTASRSLSTVRNFLRAHDLGFAAVFPDADGAQLVLWSDIRFCWDPQAPGAAQVEPLAVAADGTRIACGLWFGGEIDRRGRPIREIVRIGAWTQTRPPG